MEDISRDFVQPFRLSRAPLVRVVIVEIENSGYLLVVDMHHIISDGFSHGIVTGNFMALLMGEKLPPLRLQYKDYSGWQNSTKQKESIEKQKQYWLSRFAGEIPVLNMPLDYPRPPVKSFQGSEIRSELGGELTAKLKEFIYKIDITMYMVLIAAYSVLLMKYTGQEDILVGFPVSGRTNAELHQIIGLFANILVMRTNPHPGKTFQQFQEEVKQRAVEAFENQDYQFDELIETLDIPGNRNRHPLIDTVFAYQNAAGKETEAGNPVLDSIKDIPYRFHQKEIQHELLLDAEETPNNITLALQYSTVLYKESTARGMCGHYIEILEQVTQNPKITLKDIKISIDLAAMPVEDEKYEGDFVF